MQLIMISPDVGYMSFLHIRDSALRTENSRDLAYYEGFLCDAPWKEASGSQSAKTVVSFKKLDIMSLMMIR
ncbi:hypothetical protein ASE00_02070 [Sphingomonas sp. Root710]|nr:hypothetical protein ASE00_02070 [Sphingomonas sp. Root710]